MTQRARFVEEAHSPPALAVTSRPSWLSGRQKCINPLDLVQMLWLSFHHQWIPAWKVLIRSLSRHCVWLLAVKQQVHVYEEVHRWSVWSTDFSLWLGFPLSMLNQNEVTQLTEFVCVCTCLCSSLYVCILHWNLLHSLCSQFVRALLETGYVHSSVCKQSNQITCLISFSRWASLFEAAGSSLFGVYKLIL